MEKALDFLYALSDRRTGDELDGKVFARPNARLGGSHVSHFIVGTGERFETVNPIG